MKLALAHDWLNQIGGAENVLETLVRMFPGAPVFTTIYAPELMPAAYRQWDIRLTWLNRAPGIHRHHQPYLPLYPLAVRSLDFSGFDVILSNKSGFIHGLRKAPGQVHLCYCLAPTRYVWDYGSYAARERIPPLADLLLRPLIAALRRWDYRAAQQVDHFCAISTDIQQRIRRYYHRDSVIIHPPVNTDRFQPVPHPTEDYYFILSRLIPYKRIDLAVEAFTRMGKRLIITGDGRDRQALEALAGPTVTFTGRLPWNEVTALMANCKAFLFPGYEDFGITPVEAQAAGRPVIAYAAGGSLDTVIEGETGVFFRQQTVESLIEAVQRLEGMAFDPAHIRRHAERFSVPRFRRELLAWIADCTGYSTASK
ncbi:MAG: glycosyltransferase family 4 protein [Caldilineae bacterium]|nr:MAG: glycosyltransferase family 4 protein [Caldilineae bacterium]